MSQNFINQPFVNLMARYNQWMNRKIFQHAAHLSEERYRRDVKAYFVSLDGTLNHILVADLIWLRRFASHGQYPALAGVADGIKIKALDQKLFDNLTSLTARREEVDTMILKWSSEITDGDLQRDLNYQDLKGNRHRTPMGVNVMHFFNHQTHHRGQATTIFKQFGVDVGVTDLAVYFRDNL